MDAHTHTLTHTHTHTLTYTCTGTHPHAHVYTVTHIDIYTGIHVKRCLQINRFLNLHYANIHAHTYACTCT